MSKAALWNVNTDDLDSRRAASEAASRQGRSLGEWLHAPLAEDDAASCDLDGARWDASRPTGDAHRDDNRVDLFGSRIGLTRRDSAPESRPSESNDPPDMSLARAIDAMERRTLRNKRRHSAAWEPVSRPQERYDTKRDRVAELAERLAEIETHLTDRFPPVENNPVGATLARLEARLESMGRHSLAEVVALQHTFSQAQKPAVQTDGFHRLEEKLDSILAAVRAWPSEASSIALVASQAIRARGDRDLDSAIDDIARRQKTLHSSEPLSLKQAVQRRAIGTHRQPPFADTASVAAVQSEIAALASKIEGLCHDVAERRGDAPAHDLHPLRSDIAAMGKSLRELSRHVDLSSAETSAWALIETLDTVDGFETATLRSVKGVVTDLCRILADIDLTKEIKGATDKLRAIGRKIDDLEPKKADPGSIDSLRRSIEDVRALIAALVAQPSASERIKHLIGSLRALLVEEPTGTVQDIDAVIEELRDLVTNPPSGSAFNRVDAGIDALDTEVDDAIAGSKHGRTPRIPSLGNPGELESLLRGLSHKMEAVQAPGADHQAIEALQQQIALLSARFESSDDGFAKLNNLQQSMQDVLSHLEQTRVSVEASAAEAAREVLRIAVENGQAGDEKPSAASLSKIQLMQDEAEARTGSALSAVQETLTKVVDRLSAMESDITEVRNARKVPALPNETPSTSAAVVPLGAPDLILDRALGGPPIEAAVKTPVVAKPSTDAVAFVEPETETDRADFIAAARRAAKAAQNDLHLTEVNRTITFEPKGDPRALLIERSRDYIARHKKPVLLGVAALFVIVGTVAIMQRVGLNGNGLESAWLKPRAQTATTAKSTSRPEAVRTVYNGTTKPAASATSPVKTALNSDPVHTGSIAPLPVFAAPLATPAAPPAPAIPVKLKAMAEAGDSGAEYVLGMQYAEGRGIPRDFKIAANWYQKAADQGVAPAQYRLASLYEKGLGVAQDKIKARSLYLQAAEAGNPRAMHNLAVLLADGDGKPDYGGAATWFRKAAQYGMEDSQFNLAILLARGLGVQQSLVQSYQWFAIAAAQDDSDAAKKRDEVGSKLSAADLAVAKTLAASFRPRTVTVAATEVQPPPGGWDGASKTSPLNSAKQKLSSL